MQHGSRVYHSTVRIALINSISQIYLYLHSLVYRLFVYMYKSSVDQTVHSSFSAVTKLLGVDEGGALVTSIQKSLSLLAV